MKCGEKIIECQSIDNEFLGFFLSMSVFRRFGRLFFCLIRIDLIECRKSLRRLAMTVKCGNQNRFGYLLIGKSSQYALIWVFFIHDVRSGVNCRKKQQMNLTWWYNATDGSRYWILHCVSTCYRIRN